MSSPRRKFQHDVVIGLIDPADDCAGPCVRGHDRRLFGDIIDACSQTWPTHRSGTWPTPFRGRSHASAKYSYFLTIFLITVFSTSPCSSRASSIAAFEGEAGCGRRQRVPRWSAGRRRALTLRAHAPRDPHPLKTRWVSEARRVRPADRKAGQGSLASSLAPPGAPSPRFEGRRKTGRRANPGRPKPSAGAAERWLSAVKVNEATRVIRACPSPLWGGWPSGGDSRARPGGVGLTGHTRLRGGRATNPTRFALGFPPREPPSPQGGGIACSPQCLE